MNFPPEETEPLIAALRDELQEYGALLRLLETQQRNLVKRDADDDLDLDAEIERHLAVLMRSRRRRQDEVRSLLGEGTAPAVGNDVGLDGLLPFFPVTVAPMIGALIEEVNRLITRVSCFARQNSMLLALADGSAPAALQTAGSGSVQKTYTYSGRMSQHASLIESLGALAGS